MTVLVTGGCGFVGRAITRKCLEQGYSVLIVDDLSTGKHPDQWLPGWEQKSLQFVLNDVRDFFKLVHAGAFDLIFHCAAVVGGRKMIDGAPLKVATDLSIDAEFFNWCCAGTKLPTKVIYFSSSAIYPTELQTERLYVKLSEALCKIGVPRLGMPDQTYGWAKLSGEVLMHHAVKSYGLNCVCYRPFSGYGEDQDFDYPFPSIIRRIGRKENPVQVWGTGQQVRDFIHIEDAVDAVFQSSAKMQPGETINLGSGEPTSFIELIKLAMKTLGHEAEIETVPAEPSGVFYRVADTFAMNKYYVPRIKLKDGIKRVHAYQERMGLLTEVPEEV